MSEFHQTFMQSLAQKIFATSLPTQFDEDFRTIASRQCSWFAVNLASRWETFLWLYLSDNSKLFTELYASVLNQSSHLKRLSVTCSHIETLFHNSILSTFKEDACFKLSSSFKRVHFNPDQEDIFLRYLLRISRILKKFKNKNYNCPLYRLANLLLIS